MKKNEIFMRLNKFLSLSGIASRRKSDDLIKMATTEVNGKVCLDPAFDVNINDRVSYEGKTIKLITDKIVLMLNKPANVITTVKDTHGRKTVMDFVKSKTRLTPIGRLDRDTTGLLLLTNDGDLQQFLTHPSNRISKDYIAIIEGRMKKLDIEKLNKGVYIGNKEYGKAKILKQETIKGRSKITLRLKHGKKREIRRIFFRMRKKLLSLKRIGLSKLKLGDLREGCFRQLTDNEIKSLYQR